MISSEIENNVLEHFNTDVGVFLSNKAMQLVKCHAL